MSKEWMSVGELAKAMNVSIRTLQYYDTQKLLSPSGRSEGGKRRYSRKDMVKLHQILSFKYLGFSLEEIRDHVLPLDTPQEVAVMLEQQQHLLYEAIQKQQKAYDAISALKEEVLCMKEVSFEKYADIIQLLRMDQKEYWVWKLMDEQLTEHIQTRFVDQQMDGEKILSSYYTLVEQILLLQEQQVSPSDDKAQEVADAWWNMVMEFTGGDMSLLPKLEEFNQKKEHWNADMAKKQKAIDAYLQELLACYMSKPERQAMIQGAQDESN